MCILLPRLPSLRFPACAPAERSRSVQKVALYIAVGRPSTVTDQSTASNIIILSHQVYHNAYDYIYTVYIRVYNMGRVAVGSKSTSPIQVQVYIIIQYVRIILYNIGIIIIICIIVFLFCWNIITRNRNDIHALVYRKSIVCYTYTFIYTPCAYIVLYYVYHDS